MAKKGKFRYDPENPGVVQQGFNVGGETVWYNTRLPALPGEEIPIRGSGQMKQGGKKKRQKQAAQEAYRENMDAIRAQREDEVLKMGFGEKGMLLYGRELDKLGAGAANIGDFLGDVVGMDTTDRFLERQRRQASRDDVSDMLEENAGAAALFKGIPYLATGWGAGPAFQKGAQVALSRTAQAADVAAKTGRGALTRGVEAMAASPRMGVGQMGRRLKREITDPLAERSARKAQQIQYENQFRKGIGSRILGDVALGSAESALHYDQDFVEGGIASLFGRMGGEMMGPAVRRSPNFYSPQDKALIDWGESQGMQFLPGQRTGNRGQQMFEAGMRSDADWATTVRQFDANNETIMNRIAYETMGIPRGQVDAMTPDKLRIHKDNLKKEYQALEAGTVGRIDAPVMRELDAHIKSLESLKGADAVENAAAARAAYDNLQNLSTRDVRKDARGRFVQRTFDGKEYQTLQTNLKDQITKAYKDGNVGRARALTPMLDQLNAGMEKGIREFGGEASAAQWKDLNERYAMTKLFIEKGSTPTGNIDPARLTAYFQSSDPERMLLESGGRVTDLHKLAKLNYVMKNQAGSALTGTGMMTYKKNPSKQSMSQRLLSSPLGSAVPIVPEMMLKRYASGYPSVSGYLGMGIGDDLAGRPFLGGNLGRLWDHPGLYTRALAQGTQVHPAAIQGGIDSLDWLVGEGEEAANTMQNLFTLGGE